jgi:hypothetical protein
MGKQLVKASDIVGGRYKITGPFLGEGSFSEARDTHARRATASRADRRACNAVQVYPAEDLHESSCQARAVGCARLAARLLSSG